MLKEELEKAGYIVYSFNNKSRLGFVLLGDDIMGTHKNGTFTTNPIIYDESKTADELTYTANQTTQEIIKELLEEKGLGVKKVHIKGDLPFSYLAIETCVPELAILAANITNTLGWAIDVKSIQKGIEKDLKKGIGITEVKKRKRKNLYKTLESFVKGW